MTNSLERKIKKLSSAEAPTDNPGTFASHRQLLGQFLDATEVLCKQVKGTNNKYRIARRCLLATLEIEQAITSIVETGEDKSFFSYGLAYCVNHIEATANLYAVRDQLVRKDVTWEGDEMYEGFIQPIPSTLTREHPLDELSVPKMLRSYFQKDTASTFHIIRAVAKITDKQKREISDDEFIMLTKLYRKNMETEEGGFSGQDGYFYTSLPFLSETLVGLVRASQRDLLPKISEDTKGIIRIFDQYFSVLHLAFLNEDNQLHDVAYQQIEFFLKGQHAFTDLGGETHLGFQIEGFFEKHRLYARALARRAKVLLNIEEDEVVSKYCQVYTEVHSKFFDHQIEDPELVLSVLDMMSLERTGTGRSLSSLTQEAASYDKVISADYELADLSATLDSRSTSVSYILDLVEENLLLIDVRFGSNEQDGESGIPLGFTYIVTVQDGEEFVAFFDSVDNLRPSPQSEQLLTTLARVLLESHLNILADSQDQNKDQKKPPRVPIHYLLKKKGPEQTPRSVRKRKNSNSEQSNISQLYDDQPTLQELVDEQVLSQQVVFDRDNISNINKYEDNFLDRCQETVDRWNNERGGIFKALKEVSLKGRKLYSLRFSHTYRIIIEKVGDDYVATAIVHRKEYPTLIKTGRI